MNWAVTAMSPSRSTMIGIPKTRFPGTSQMSKPWPDETPA